LTSVSSIQETDGFPTGRLLEVRLNVAVESSRDAVERLKEQPGESTCRCHAGHRDEGRDQAVLNQVLTVVGVGQQLESQHQVPQSKAHKSSSPSGNNLLTLLAGYAMFRDSVSKIFKQENRS
jgi:hypothetical protein